MWPLTRVHLEQFILLAAERVRGEQFLRLSPENEFSQISCLFQLRAQSTGDRALQK